MEDVCEWCGMTYPHGTYYYKKIKVRDMRVLHSNYTDHIICKDCYDRLKDVE